MLFRSNLDLGGWEVSSGWAHTRDTASQVVCSASEARDEESNGGLLGEKEKRCPCPVHFNPRNNGTGKLELLPGKPIDGGDCVGEEGRELMSPHRPISSLYKHFSPFTQGQSPKKHTISAASKSLLLPHHLPLPNAT